MDRSAVRPIPPSQPTRPLQAFWTSTSPSIGQSPVCRSSPHQAGTSKPAGLPVPKPDPLDQEWMLIIGGTGSSVRKVLIHTRTLDGHRPFAVDRRCVADSRNRTVGWICWTGGQRGSIPYVAFQHRDEPCFQSGERNARRPSAEPADQSCRLIGFNGSAFKPP